MIMNPHPTSLPRSLLAALILAMGFGVAWFTIFGWVGFAALWSAGRSHGVSETLIVGSDGTPLIQTIQWDNRSRVTTRDLSGRPRDVVDRSNEIPAIYLYPPRETGLGLFSPLTWHQRIKVFLDERQPDAVWYFLHDGRSAGSGYFVGYERGSNRRIGYIGLSGPSEQPPRAEDRIPVRGELLHDYESWSSAGFGVYSMESVGALDSQDLPPRLVHLPSGKLLRLVDLDARTVKTVFEAPELISSVGVPLLKSFASGFKSTSEPPILVMADRTIYRLDRAYDVKGTFTLPSEVEPQSLIIWYETAGGQAIVQCTVRSSEGDARGAEGATRVRLYRVARDGTVQETHDVSLRSGGNQPSEWAAIWLGVVSLPSPVVLIATGLIAAATNPARGAWAMILHLLRISWPALAAVLVLSLILAAITWRRSRAFGFSERECVSWSSFVLLFGVPGFVGFLAHRRWPVRLPCPHCQARTPRDRAACSACGEPFPPAPLKGNEVFA